MPAPLDVPLLDEPAFEHLVHLYDTEATLAVCVLAFLSPALPGEAALVVATPAHRALIARTLEDCGVDLEALRQEGRYVERDADQLLRSFLRDDGLDPAAFHLSVGRPVRALAAAYGRVHVYGEMITCLWGRGDSRAAAVLERAWNDLAGTAEFRLCCAYPLTALTTGAPAAAGDVRARHSLVAD